MHFIPRLALIAAMVAAVSCGSQIKSLKEASLPENLPFDMPAVERPVIPSYSVSIADFGAVPDGVTLNSDAFAKAFQAVSRQGGGRVVVPEGIWLTGPVTLLSNTELHLKQGAIILFSDNEDLYPVIDTNFEGLDLRRCISPINATGAHDIAITGNGIIEGNGDAWREVKHRKVGDDIWKTVIKRKGGVLSDDGKVWYPNEGYKKARLSAGSLNKPSDDLDESEIKTFLRPVLVSLRSCERVLLEDVTFQNSPCWNVHPLWCKNLTINNITVRCAHYSTNGDGIDIDGCENVLLTNSTFDVGDDAICIKSGKDEDGRRHARACRNLIIRGCTVYHGHGGFVIGSEMSGGVDNIYVSDCSFLGTDVGLRFKSTRGRGGVVKNIWCDGIRMKDIESYGVIFNLYYAGVAASDMQGVSGADMVTVSETTPEFRDIHISNVICAGAKQAIYINGLPELPLDGVDFHNCIFSAKKGLEMFNVGNVLFDNVTVNGKKI